MIESTDATELKTRPARRDSPRARVNAGDPAAVAAIRKRIAAEIEYYADFTRPNNKPQWIDDSIVLLAAIDEAQANAFAQCAAVARKYEQTYRTAAGHVGRVCGEMLREIEALAKAPQ